MAKKRTRKKSNKKAKRTLLGRLTKWGFVAALWAGIFMTVLVAWYAQELPDITERASFERKMAITIKDEHGAVIARYGEIMGNSVTVEELPPHLIYAVMAIEDRRFYEHFGMDPVGLARATFVNIRDRRISQGGSTVTQQLAKNLFLSKERTLKRKIQEALLAFWLEHQLTKDEIMSAYLNRVYLGAGTYGVDAASKMYFDKPVEQINLREAALLAGLLKAPSRYSPTKNPGLAKKRTDVVLNAMVDAGYIEQQDADDITSLPPRPMAKPTGARATRYYTDWIVDGLEDLIGTPEKDLVVETTFNGKIQEHAEIALARALRENDEERLISQGAVVVMRPGGAVVAMVGGRDYAQSQFNRITQAKRPPGSSFKPVVYLTALEQGWSPGDLIIDEPFTEGEYRPKNFGNEYHGEVSLEVALMLSLNTVSVRLMKEMNAGPVIETARRLGIYSPLERDLSLALGSSGVSPLEMATAYSVLANGGHAVFPYAITKITTEDGELYYSRPQIKTTRRVIDSDDVEDLSAMMQNVLEYGTGQRAKVPFPASGKTGTSNDTRDAWFIGFTDELVAAVWMGNDDNSPMENVTGGSFPAGVWQEIMMKSRGRYKPVHHMDFSIADGFHDLMDRMMRPDSREKRQRWRQERRSAGRGDDNNPHNDFDRLNN